MMAETKTLQLEDDEWMDWETRHPHVPMWKHMIAGKHDTPCSNYSHILILGSCAGIVEHCAMFPFDTVKVSPNLFQLTWLDAYASQWGKAGNQKRGQTLTL